MNWPGAPAKPANHPSSAAVLMPQREAPPSGRRRRPIAINPGRITCRASCAGGARNGDRPRSAGANPSHDGGGARDGRASERRHPRPASRRERCEGARRRQAPQRLRPRGRGRRRTGRRNDDACLVSLERSAKQRRRLARLLLAKSMRTKSSRRAGQRIAGAKVQAPRRGRGCSLFGGDRGVG